MAALAVATDQIPKTLVRRYLPLCVDQPIETCAQRASGPLRIVNTQNQALALGLLPGPWVTALGIAGVMLVFILVFTPSGQKGWGGWPGALAAGGAASNLYDRLSTGAVTDVIDITWFGGGGIILNPADIWLTAGLAVGTIIALRSSIRTSKIDRNTTSTPIQPSLDPQLPPPRPLLAQSLPGSEHPPPSHIVDAPQAPVPKPRWLQFRDEY